ncbi:MAG: phage tail tape measure protein, partial [Bacteroidetes bacterium]|nr:phage tail tape measure protein [Bacteroidota bacterium]
MSSSSNLSYTITFQDNMSLKLKNLSKTMVVAGVSVGYLQNSLKNLQKTTNSCGGSIDNLLKKTKKFKNLSKALSSTGASAKVMSSNMKTLKKVTNGCSDSVNNFIKNSKKFKKESPLVNSKDISNIKKYHEELSRPLKATKKLELPKKGGFLPNPMNMAKNFAVEIGKSGMNFAENMAKFNIKAQLDEKSLKGVYKKVFTITKNNKGDIDKAPIVLGNLMDKTNNVALSFDILDTAMSGARTGISDVDTISDALAESLTHIGKGNASAEEVLDTFIATSRVGAGGFQEVANYMPTLISGASKVGVSYKEVGGLFAFMTNMGKSAGQTSTLMESMFDAIGNSDIQKNLQGKGINILDKDGTIGSIDEISKQMSKLLDGKTSGEKSNILNSLGINDGNAVEVFSMLGSNADNLSSSLNSVSSSAGETQRAIAFSINPMQKATELWSSLRTQMTEVGVKILPLINSALIILSPLIGGLVGALGVWSDGISNGSIGAYALLGAVTGLTTAYVINKGVVLAQSIVTDFLTAKTWLCNIAHKALKVTMATTPWGLIALGVGAAVGAIIAMNSPVNRLNGAMNKLKSTFADFNVELSVAKTESNDAFDSAMKAKIGSEERAKAINKINDQYSTYLPCLLTENSTNKELVSSLKSVNVQFENKLKNKFKEKELTSLKGEFYDIKKELYEIISDSVAVEDLPQVYNNTDKIISKLENNDIDLTEAYKLFRGNSKYWFSQGKKIGDATNGSFIKVKNYFTKEKKELQMINAMYSVKETKSFAVQKDVASKIKGNRIENDKKEERKNINTSGTTNNTSRVVTNNTATNNTGDFGSTVVPNKDVFNLDSVKNLKGTTTYGAIMEKLAPLSKTQIKALEKTNAVPLAVEKANAVPTVVAGKIKNANKKSDVATGVPY